MSRLHHSSDRDPGLTRRWSGKGFVFVTAQGRVVKDAKTIARCEALGIPPAYNDVWICPDSNGHLQATAIDARGRKQYLYHPDWNAHQNATKYHRLIEFADALSQLRPRLARDLRLRGIPREKVLAAIVRLLDTAYIRIGNEEYAKQNKSYGLTTLLDRHLRGRGQDMQLVFRGKSGVVHDVPIEDKRVRDIMATCQDLPGQELFAYKDTAGQVHDIKSDDVNTYLKAIGHADITAKDFRTWHGTVLAATELAKCAECNSAAERKRNIVAAVKVTAAALGNTVAVCKKGYIHPYVLTRYLGGKLDLPEPTRALKRRYPNLHQDELRVLVFLASLPKRQPKNSA